MYRIGGKQRMNYLENHYANYDEEGRLASKHGQVEFFTTMKYIHEFIGDTEKRKILEVGAGTGRYIMLVLGPMYHMYTKENKQKVLEEAIRVTKKQGHILRLAFCKALKTGELMEKVYKLEYEFIVQIDAGFLRPQYIPVCHYIPSAFSPK